MGRRQPTAADGGEQQLVAARVFFAMGGLSLSLGLLLGPVLQLDLRYISPLGMALFGLVYLGVGGWLQREGLALRRAAHTRRAANSG